MRKMLSAVVLLTAVLIGAMASGSAFAQRGFRHHHHRAHVGVFIGAPLVFAPWYYYHPAPVYYPAPVVAYPPAPAVYVEQGQEAAPAPRSDASYWYYCPGAKAYYPYVTQCAGGWQRVSPQPPPS